MMAILVPPATPVVQEQLGSFNPQIVQYVEVLLGLIGVLVLAYVSLRVGLPWLSRMRNPAEGLIEVLARHSLEPRKSLYLIKLGSQLFLIGTAENQVRYLAAVSDENAVEMVRSAQSREARTVEFRQLLSRFQRFGKAE